MGLIKNAVEQAKLATQNITKELKKSSKTEFDVFIVGAGPAGIAASLMSKKSLFQAKSGNRKNTLGTPAIRDSVR